MSKNTSKLEYPHKIRINIWLVTLRFKLTLQQTQYQSK